MISFNVPPYIGGEEEKIAEVIRNRKISGDGAFTKKCNAWIEQKTGTLKALLTTSCTHALEMSALLSDVRSGDEVIMSSFTFVSTANAFVLRGAKIVFVDIRPDTMNIDEEKIESAITDRTRAIAVTHYAGVGCEMDRIMEIAAKRHLLVIEDAAQGVMASYKGRALGAIGDFGCYSFHETKNYSMGEGGAILLKNPEFVERAEILREKGTNRSQFWRGKVDKYTWVDFGSSYLPSELNAAYLYAQLEKAEMVNENRLKSWRLYDEGLQALSEKGLIQTPVIPNHCEHNAHMYYIKVQDINERDQLIRYLKQNEIESVFHYVPLHSAPAGKIWSRFAGEDQFTTTESERLLRLPMYYGLSEADVHRVVETVGKYFR